MASTASTPELVVDIAPAAVDGEVAVGVRCQFNGNFFFGFIGGDTVDGEGKFVAVVERAGKSIAILDAIVGIAVEVDINAHGVV